MNPVTRSFSTAARVHPSILPHLHASPRRAPIRRWFKTAVVISAVVYASKTYLDFTRYSSSSSHPSSSSQQQQQQQHSHTAKDIRAALQEQDNESLRRQRMMEDLYGGRESLEDLERGVAEYARR